jgi:hypothetical protein
MLPPDVAMPPEVVAPLEVATPPELMAPPEDVLPPSGLASWHGSSDRQVTFLSRRTGTPSYGAQTWK